MEEDAQIDLFHVSAYDPPLRDNRDVMEYPFLSIQKGRRKPIEFSSSDGRVYVEVQGLNDYGIANIWDWDVIIYLSAHVNDAIEAGLKPSRVIEFAPYDALKYLGRTIGGRQYKELADTIRRLNTTHVRTSVRETDTEGFETGFRWLEGYWIPKKYAAHQFLKNRDDGEPDGGKPWRVKLPDWIFNAIERRSGILAVHQDYFKITSGLERWLYRLARKSVPDKANFPSINFRMETLHERSGSTRPLFKFAHDMRKIEARQALPEYSIHIHKDGKHQLVTLMRDRSKAPRIPRGVRLKLIEG